ncbi:aminotransferase class III-fold pyridoxal phosphate-dependent enzyme [Hankyongella ginsenosidimutans]|uniref:aminotransferase class III-fold pyridoxal phosphate-dependent enzyme n=1 Tax=Hankyongella ginsenosidimutans TaxID=1763828 RepID=UPI00248250D1|nr:aminotransferase class III-fold pyridoxal phosphate-dependent enzyme [Hankyongella ginsenosidimutans]
MTAPRRNYDVAELRRLDVAHHLPAQADYRLIAEMGGSRIITRAEGCVITDGDGVEILDGMAGLWCVNVGYGREELAKAAHAQMLDLPYYNSFFKTANPPAVQLAARISGLLDHKLPHVFFNSSGSEANDTVLRLVRYYWTLKGEPQRQTVIARWNGYHGSTVAGASLGGMKAMHAQGTADPRHRACHAALLVRGGLRRGPGGLRPARRPGDRGAHTGGRAGNRGGRDRRAGAGCWWRRHPA